MFRIIFVLKSFQKYQIEWVFSGLNEYWNQIESFI